MSDKRTLGTWRGLEFDEVSKEELWNDLSSASAENIKLSREKDELRLELFLKGTQITKKFYDLRGWIWFLGIGLGSGAYSAWYYLG